MVAIVTDVHYRMSLAVVRDLGEAGVTVICCESDRFKGKNVAPPLGALSRYCTRHVWLSEADYIDSLEDLCRTIGDEYRCCPALLPVGARTLAEVAANRERFDEVCCCLIPSAEQLSLFNSKDQVAVLAGKHGIPTPVNYVRNSGEKPEDFVRRLSFPCVIKPVCGEKLGLSAAQRYQFANSEAEALSAFTKYFDLAEEDPVVQHRLTGGGLGLSVLAENGRIVRSICHRRVREYPISGGPSSCCRTENRSDLLAWVNSLVGDTCFSGLAMFEFKEDHRGEAHLLEVNPRIWGTFPMTRISKSGMTFTWFCLAWNHGNPENPVKMPDEKDPEMRKMKFLATDILACVGYLRHGKLGKAMGAVLDCVNPMVRDGVFEWKDAAPGIMYFRSLLTREKKR